MCVNDIFFNVLRIIYSFLHWTSVISHPLPIYSIRGTVFFFFLNFYLLFIYYLFLAVLGLRFCAKASSWGKQGPLFIAMHGPLTITASLVGSTGSRRAGSVVVAHGPSCSAVCGIFPDQGSNPRPLHWQADSQPLRHQGSPGLFFSYRFTVLFIY